MRKLGMSCTLYAWDQWTSCMGMLHTSVQVGDSMEQVGDGKEQVGDGRGGLILQRRLKVKVGNILKTSGRCADGCRRLPLLALCLPSLLVASLISSAGVAERACQRRRPKMQRVGSHQQSEVDYY